MCVLCHESLAVAQSAESYQERAYVRTFVAQGLTVKQIEDRMVGLYGTGVLAQPPKHGFSLLVYIIPPVVVLAGILLLFYTVPRWRRKAAAARDAAGGRRGTGDLRAGVAAARRGTGRALLALRPTIGRQRPARYERDIESGALTPSSHSDSAITCRAAWESATRNDSTDAGSAPITLQSR